MFRRSPDPVRAGRYHSLTIGHEGLPACLEIIADSKDGEIMGVGRRALAVEGVHFHSESVLTARARFAEEFFDQERS